MKKQIIIGLIGVWMLFGSSLAMAQNPPKHKDREEKEAQINELRKQYFNDKLALSESEQKAFWPLYDEYRQKEKTLRDSFHKKYKKNDVVFMDEKKAEDYLNVFMKLKDDQNKLYKDYIGKYKKVLPVKKVAMIPMLENEFKKEIMRKAMPAHGKGKPEGGGDD